MKRFAIAALFAATSSVAFAATDVGVSISVGQPGFYGRIDIGNAPPPVLVYPQPVVIQPVRVRAARAGATALPARAAGTREGLEASTAASTTRARGRSTS